MPIHHAPNFLGTFTYAALPSAASNSGKTAIASNIGIAPGMLLVSDGTRWKPLGMQCLARSAVAASVTGTLSETALATVAVPAGLMGTDGGLLVYSSWSYTSSANNKLLRIRLGGIAGTQFLGATLTTTSMVSDMRRIRNRNSAASQVGSTGIGSVGLIMGSSTTLPTAAINTAVSQDLVFSGDLDDTGETIALENYEVWATP